jgi:L-asparaginase/Glu-tRNA(Gln) amidotransferase subunit D/tRNA A-37 threonylcarbamoyl transferase component Bud32
MNKSDTSPYSVDSVLKTLDGEWRLTEELGEGQGSSAWVFKAVHAKDSNRICALKIFKPWVTADQETYNETMRRLERQLLLRAHDCPYLIKILEAGVLPDRAAELYLAMDYIPGNNLEKLRAQVPVERVRPLISQVAKAVKYLRAGEVFHRDIKPANVIVSPDFRKAILADLGIAVQTSRDQQVTNTTTFLGTPRYSPPEFIDNPSIREPVAIDFINYYQLGALLYELITRKQLFQGVKRENLFEEIKKGVPPLNPTELDPSLRDLAELAGSALRTTPTERSLSYDSFIFEQDPLKPTILFLHAGGTVSSEADSHIRAARVVEVERDDLPARFTARMKRDYKFLHPDYQDIPFEIEWSAMPKSHQILSENASVDYWNALSLKIEEMIGSPKSDRYVLGVVVLHGTDTMAYSCAALTFALSKLPCPIVLTGSNLPPLETSTWEQDSVVGTSDVWRNLLGAIHFLETFGHRHPEVWLSFAETVLLAVNVRKTVEPSLVGSESSADVATVLGEPFTFRRPEPYARYDFKAIDGTYVNNFYPLRNKDYRQLIAIDRASNRHRRPVFGPEVPEALERTELKGDVIVWSVSPTATRALIPDQDRDAKRALLIDGYSSGTFPNIESHPAVETLRDAIRFGIPVVVVSGDGLLPTIEQYAVQPIDNTPLHVLRLYGIVKESAVPLIYRVLTEIPLEKWTSDKSSQARLTLMREYLVQYFNTHESVANLLLGKIDDPADLRNDLVERLQYRFISGAQPLNQLLSGVKGEEEWSRSVKRAHKKPRAGRSHTDDITILPRRLLIYALGQSLRLHDIAGAGPDASEIAYELGYQIGRSLMKEEEYVIGTMSSKKLFYDLPEVDRRRFLTTGKYFIRRIVNVIRWSGFADIQVDRITLPFLKARMSLLDIGKPPGFIGFRFWVRKFGLLTRSDELYGVHAATEADREFFRMIAHGVPLTMLRRDEFRRHAEVELDNLYRSTWDLKLSVLDWVLVGMGKAIAVGVTSYLNIDPSVESWKTRGGKHLAALRSSVGIEIDVGSDKELIVSYRYSPRLIVMNDGRVEPAKDPMTSAV